MGSPGSLGSHCAAGCNPQRKLDFVFVPANPLSLFLPRPAYSEVPGKTILALREELGESGFLHQGVGDQKKNVMQLDCL